jgi:hypothetical protein
MSITRALYHSCFIATLSVSVLCASPLQAAGMKKWVDEDGQVHYGDRIPPEYLRGEHSVINEQGIEVRKNAAMKTEEELKREAELLKHKQSEERKRQIEARKQALRDRVLTDTFTSENDLVIARDARVDAVDSQISLTKTLIEHDQQRLRDVQSRIKSIEASGREAPENLHKEVISLSRQLENNEKFIADRKKERQKIIDSFDADIKRFRELMQDSSQ